MYIRLSGRVQVNAASLNAQGTVGNLVELTKLRIIVGREGNYEPVEVSAISGNTIKHWHFVHFIDHYLQNGGTRLCDDCKRGVAFRTRNKQGNDEANYIRRCAAEDVHGFLMTDVQVRRESLVKFSFLLPVEEVMEHPIDTVTHNRVVVNPQGKIEGEAGMMLFKRQYASDVYGFSSLADVAEIGIRAYSADKTPVYEGDEIAKRAKAAVSAFVPLLSGLAGANLSRSLPAFSVKELIVAYSKKPLPLMAHGFFKDYLVESIRTLGEYSKLTGVKVNVSIYGIKAPKEAEEYKGELTIKPYEAWQQIFRDLVSELSS